MASRSAVGPRRYENEGTNTELVIRSRGRVLEARCSTDRRETNYRLRLPTQGRAETLRGGLQIRACHLTPSQIDLLFPWDRPRCPQRRNSRVCAAPIEEQPKAV